MHAIQRERRRPDPPPTTRDDVVGLLGGSPLFTGVGQAELRRIADQLDEQHYLCGHRILTEGMRGVGFFVVVDGAAVVEAAGHTVAELGPGDFFGEVAALDQGPRTATVRASTALRCLALPNGSLMGFLQEHPRFALNMLDGSVRRFRAAVTPCSSVRR